MDNTLKGTVTIHLEDRTIYVFPACTGRFDIGDDSLTRVTIEAYCKEYQKHKPTCVTPAPEPEKLVVLHKGSLKDAYSRTWWKETGLDLLKAFLSSHQVLYVGFSAIPYTVDSWFQCSRECMGDRLALIERWANGECSITLDHCLIEGESIAFDVKGMDYKEYKWTNRTPTARVDWRDILPTIEKFIKYGGSKERLFPTPYCTPQFMAAKLPFIRAFIDCKEVVCAEETDYWVDGDGYEHFCFTEHPDLYTLLE